jgi:GGDEF domain-containing protein
LLEQAVDRLSFTFRGRDVIVGASAGVAILGPHAEAGRALEEADRAMYVRKAQRRHEMRHLPTN